MDKHLDKDNLHHAYLIEGDSGEIEPQILDFIKKLGIKTVANPDFSHITLDSFKIEDARNLKALGAEKSMSAGKRIFLISANNFLLEAQNTLLKIFEEPIENTHFFIIVPDAGALLKTFVSRFYLISNGEEKNKELKEAETFLSLHLTRRIDFVKELIVDEEREDENGEEMAQIDSGRSKAIRFLNALEVVLHRNLEKNKDCFPHFFKVRQFLRQPGSSAKNLMESVAVIVPSY